jgi:hypothetical protein
MSNLISPKLNFREFLNALAGMDRREMIRAASREYRGAIDTTVKRGSGTKAEYQKIQDYGIDLRDFIEFLETTADLDTPLSEAHLASDEYRHKQLSRTFGF